MARRVFFSFHYDQDHWRASQVRNMGIVEKNPLASDNEWEAIKSGGSAAIERWINSQMVDRSCAIVLIGRNTAGRKWVNYEIVKAWNDGKGLFGIYIHHLKNKDGLQTLKGFNPFEGINFEGGSALSTVIPAYDPPYSQSTDGYAYISAHLSNWVERAIAARRT